MKLAEILMISTNGKKVASHCLALIAAINLVQPSFAQSETQLNAVKTTFKAFEDCVWRNWPQLIAKDGNGFDASRIDRDAHFRIKDGPSGPCWKYQQANAFAYYANGSVDINVPYDQHPTTQMARAFEVGAVESCTAEVPNPACGKGFPSP
jgi:hypothetical protein